MTSNINSTNVNGAYPIAGQDNDSQGFRDNFTNIKTNLQTAYTEITALQNTSVFKGSGITNNMLGATLFDAKISQLTEKVHDVVTTVDTVSFDYSQGEFQKLTSTGSVTLEFADSSWPESGRHAKMRVQITIASVGHLITVPALWVGAKNVPGAVYNSGPGTYIITPPATGIYLFEFSTTDGGTTILMVPLITPTP